MSTDSEDSCPHCGEFVSLDDAFCHNCGASIEEEIDLLPLEEVPSIRSISDEKLLEIDSLVKEKNIVRIEWLATATDLSLEEVTSACKTLGFTVSKDTIFSPEIAAEREQKAYYTPPIKQMTVGETRKRIYGKSNQWANAGIVLLVLASLLYATPAPCVSLFGGLPVGILAIIISFVSLFSPRQKTKAIIVFVFSLLATGVWLTQYVLIWGWEFY